jgi:hypothetical protein
MADFLLTPESQAAIAAMGGYDTDHTGAVEWVT